MRNGLTAHHGSNLHTHYEKSEIYPQEEKPTRESHQTQEAGFKSCDLLE